MFETRTDIVIRGALNGMATRHRAFTDAVANAETPGFVPKTVEFEEQLRTVRDAMLADPLNASAASQPPLPLTLKESAQTEGRADGNKLSIDQQVVEMEINKLSYQALTQAARMRDEILHSVITESPR
ncbi:hypothetical protein [Armatimonas sp.]|uniref:flagellar basal body rod protein FlgB n=1 Tax=Armatimonas sp. TaxID=1872638 RepID=UPI00286B7D2E|nr:hypothetical protein [Armatimonas sp.]